jgi:hypothetical protein
MSAMTEMSRRERILAASRRRRADPPALGPELPREIAERRHPK